MTHPTPRPVLRILLPALVLAALGTFAIGDDAPPSPAGGAPTDKYSAQELQDLVAPVALYPDIVLDSLLPASTAPTDVVKAARWVASQSGEITEPPADSGWDPAVEALVQFPDVLKWMSDNLDWVEMMGYAVSVQQGEVLQAIQDYRAKAKDAGNLESNDKMTVEQQAGDTIIIYPSQPSVVYVPTYDPVAVIRPGYAWPGFWAGFTMGAMGAWAWHNISWGHHGGYGDININRNPEFNFTNNGNINRGNIGSGNRWSTTQPARPPGGRPGTTRPTQPQYRPGTGGARPGTGGVRPGTSRPGTRPSTRPGTAPGRPGTGPGATRPGPAPGVPSTRPGAGATRPGGGTTRPGGGTTRPSGGASRPSGSGGLMGGTSTNGRTTRNESSRGHSSLGSGGSRSGGASRGGSRSGGGGARSGGGARGGGGRRR